MSTVPVPGGLVAVTWVPESTVNVVAAAAPKRTPVAPVNLLPVMTTRVPPPVVPRAGETPVTETEDEGETDDGGGTMVPVPLRVMSCGRRGKRGRCANQPCATRAPTG